MRYKPCSIFRGIVIGRLKYYGNIQVILTGRGSPLTSILVDMMKHDCADAGESELQKPLVNRIPIFFSVFIKATGKGSEIINNPQLDVFCD